MNADNELAHLLLHAVNLNNGDQRSIVYGQICDYDPIFHIARATMPMLAVVDPISGQITETSQTGWLPVETMGIGFQWAPVLGDQCIVMLTEKATGAGVILPCTYSDVTPGIDKTLKAGEFTFVQRQSKSAVKYYQNGKAIRTFQKDGQGHSVVETIDENGNLSFLLPNGTQVSATPSGYSINGPEGGSGPAVVKLNNDGSFQLSNQLCFVSGSIDGTAILENVVGTIKIDSKGIISIVTLGAIITINPLVGITITSPSGTILMPIAGPILVQSNVGIQLTAPTNTIKANGNILG